MVGGGGDQEHRGHHGQREGREVHGGLPVGELAEPLGEREREEEREQHLDAGDGDPHLVQELDQLTVDPLLLRFAGFAALLHGMASSLIVLRPLHAYRVRGCPKPAVGHDRACSAGRGGYTQAWRAPRHARKEDGCRRWYVTP